VCSACYPFLSGCACVSTNLNGSDFTNSIYTIRNTSTFKCCVLALRQYCLCLCCNDENFIVNSIYGAEEFIIYGKRVTVFETCDPMPWCRILAFWRDFYDYLCVPVVAAAARPLSCQCPSYIEPAYYAHNEPLWSWLRSCVRSVRPDHLRNTSSTILTWIFIDF
jgi:hypothetical protein